MRALLLLPLLLLSACAQDMNDLEQYIAEVKERPARPLDPIPEVEPYVPADYIAADLRDPFVPNEIFNPEESDPEVQDNSGPRPIAGREKEPLEAFPIDSLRMVGSIQIGGVPYALVRSSEPFVYRVREGDYMGQNHGRVIAVSPDQLQMQELFPDGAGRWVQRDTALTLTDAVPPKGRGR